MGTSADIDTPPDDQPGTWFTVLVCSMAVLMIFVFIYGLWSLMADIIWVVHSVS